MFVLYYAKISGKGLQDHWSSGIVILSVLNFIRVFYLFLFVQI